MREAVLYEKLSDERVRCLACSWYCRIASNQLGICATRYNEKGKLYSMVYGYAIGLHLDPVEKKPLFHFYPGSTLLSFGTVGCNFGCLFCQNWQMSQINKLKIKNQKLKIKKTLQEIIKKLSQKITPRKIVQMALEMNAKGIAYTYNEPAIFVEFAYDCMRLAKKKGLKNVFVSNGFESKETFNYIKDYLDAINIDLKSIRQEFYQKICLAKIKPVKENIKRYFQTGIETEVTTLIISSLNDSNDELKEIAEFLKNISSDLPWHISAFYPAYRLTDISPTSISSLMRAYEIGKKVGLNYIYVGNVYDPQRSATYCPQCNNLLIKRDNYQGEVVGMKNNQCLKCGYKIYGCYV